MDQEVKYTRILSTPELIKVLGCASSTVRSAIRHGNLRVLSSFQGSLFFTTDDIFEWLDHRKHGTSACVLDTITKEDFLERCKNIGVEICEF